MFQEIIDYITHINLLEFSGLFFGLLCVLLLIKEDIRTWPAGIIYVFISFYVFWDLRLYGDFILHIIFLILNIYGWVTWARGDANSDAELVVTNYSIRKNVIILIISFLGILLFRQFLIFLPRLFDQIDAAALPFWDSTTSVLSVTGIWLSVKKKLENWYYWLAVDILASGIYFYKGAFFYSLLYFIYIFLAVSGYMHWKRNLKPAHAS